jgi:hypothetical protein
VLAELPFLRVVQAVLVAVAMVLVVLMRQQVQ